MSRGGYYATSRGDDRTLFKAGAAMSGMFSSQLKLSCRGTQTVQMGKEKASSCSVEEEKER
jgi:hypothetical protein